MDIAAAIADVLRSDLTSGTASSWVAAYPNTFSAGASSVPIWMYQSLRDIWATGVSGGITDQVWQEEYIVSRFGLGESRPKTIDIAAIRTLDQADFPNGFPQSNSIAAEATEIRIYLKYPDAVPESAAEMLFNAEMRIRRLIDYNMRVNTFGNRMFPMPSPPFTGDTKVYWQGFASNDIKSTQIIYYAFYTQLTLRKPADDPVT